MAKGNLFLGTAKKTIGDIVLYRRNGVQQSRVRVRHIANPKTEAQALQRNYMAPVTKFYAPLAGVLERSWEGLNRSESLSAFLKANFTLARQRGWYVEKGTEFLALPYQVSKGILAPLTYSYNALTLASTPGDIQVSTISAILVSMGYELGDQVTFIGCVQDEAKGDIRPIWARFLLSDSDTSEIFADINGVVTFSAAEDSLAIAGVAEELVACAFIVSRWDGYKWLRSTQFVKCDEDYLQTFTTPEARAAAIASYRGGDSIVSSDVYLNGGSGSTSTKDEIIATMISKSNHQVVGYAQLIDVFQNVPNSQIVLTCKNVANGNILHAVITRASNYQVMVRIGNNFGFRSEEYSEEVAIVYTSRLGSPDLYKWLHNHGINITV